ncbi:hypothetical protein Cgig2_024683 [Carnegiea gigantea]|uniref:DUF4283 domain-containing protein n=1 Tax=Carnegiea gigantea TaxID=171969 RepID=A0A9Q1Q9I8_9CARY|nr:hypothetical protein Cgig2_024683 [Carnegiea gigantea]
MLQLNLTEEEEEIIDVPDVDSEERFEQIALCLGVDIQDLDSILFAFQFFSSIDKDFVVNGPRCFDGKILLLIEVTGLEQPSEIQFLMTRFWVKAYDIPALQYHVYLRCDSYNPRGDESLLKYRGWLRASALKSRGRSAKAKMREAKKLYLAFKSTSMGSKARVKLSFDSPVPKPKRQTGLTLDPHGEPSSQMMIDDKPLVLEGTRYRKGRVET